MDKLGESFKAIVAVFHGIISTWLFTPYAAWVAFATLLNASLLWLN